MPRPCPFPAAALLAVALAGCAVAPAHGPLGGGEVTAWPPGEGRAAAAAHPQAAELVLSALHFVDTPYRRGGNGDAGFDCSGFTRHVYARTLGLVLPRRSDEQARADGMVPVPRSGLQEGDLVFFNTLGTRYSHVGIYLGDGRFIHAPRTGAQVRIEHLGTPYWKRRYTGARRALALTAGMGVSAP